MPNGRHLRVQHTYGTATSPLLDPARREGEVGEDSVQQQHDGVVVVEERGTPAGLRQALRETRRERGRAAPWERETRVLRSPKTSTIYRGKGKVRRPTVSPRAAAARADGISPLGDLAPKPGGGNPRWGAPNPLVTWE